MDAIDYKTLEIDRENGQAIVTYLGGWRYVHHYR